MKTAHTTQHYGVFDDTLSGSMDPLHDYVRRMPLRSPHAHAYQRVWEIDDGAPMLGPPVYALADRRRAVVRTPQTEKLTFFPTQSPIDAVLSKLLRSAKRFEPWVGVKGEDWIGVSARLAVYPANSGLAWHDDVGPYSGAFNLYIHPHWEFDWGGELMFLDGAASRRRRHAIPEPTRRSDPLRGRALHPREYTRSAGSFVVPVPNRLVILSSGTTHRVGRVRPAAGRIPRIAVSGFFIRPGQGLA